MKSLLTVFLIVSIPLMGRPDRLTQLVLEDHHGMHESVTTKERLAPYQKINWLQAQPYRKSVRTYGRGKDNTVRSFVTTYHPNGQPKQYLQVVDGRAMGAYCEWYPSGTLKVSAKVVGGLAEVGESAVEGYLFDGVSEAYDADGNLLARVPYDRGMLQGEAVYYYPNGAIEETISYEGGRRHGATTRYRPDGSMRESLTYAGGLQDGPAIGYAIDGSILYREEYQQGLLCSGTYVEPRAAVERGRGLRYVALADGNYQLVQYEEGEAQGAVQVFNNRNLLLHCFHIEGNAKHGTETIFYPPGPFAREGDPVVPKLEMQWNQDELQGQIRSWYPSGVLQSRREIAANKRNGLNTAWHEDGSLMLVEEYRDDLLVKGEYYAPESLHPVSSVQGGAGTATVFDGQGHVTNRISYLDGFPIS